MMRAAGTHHISRRQQGKVTKPLAVQDARESLITATVREFFPATDDFAGGEFKGTIEGVDAKVTQEDGSIAKGIFYRVK